MARKKKHAEHVNHERWLVSYADFITLLFAFFVVMFAVSQVDSHKVGRFTEAFSKAVGIDVFPMNGASLLSGGKTPDESSGPTEMGVTTVIDELKKTLASMAANKEALQGLQVIRLRNELVLRLPEGVFFDSGDARVKDTTSRMLKVLLPELRRRPVEVRIEGHTDNRPILTGRFRSNWELSTARAEAVMAIFLVEGMLPERTSIAGYAEFRPIADNGTEDGRKQNRRVDLVVTAIVSEAPVESDPKSDLKGELKNELNGEKADSKSDKADSKTDSKSDKADSRTDSKTDKADSKTDSKSDKADSKTGIKAEPKNDKTDPKAETKGEPSTETKGEQKP